MAEEKISVCGIEVFLDDKLFAFNESNLNIYLQKAGPQCAYLQAKLAELESLHDKKYHLLFIEYKDEGGTEKYVEARCRSNPDVVDLALAIKKIKGHLRAWDMNHANAISFGHNIRREMEKLNSDIRFKADPGVDERIMDILRATHKDEKAEKDENWSNDEQSSL
ncbi:MAG: hypothetical protein M0R80_02330 [Proteobacteria bacterium]|jgi:hypothetical protein|nr:hypothetical protein [Pseudomonadota bacterium]